MNPFISVALAFDCPNGGPTPCELQNAFATTGANGLINIVDTVTNWVFTLLLVVAVLYIILAAYEYLLSGGGEEVKKAHKRLIYAGIAVAVAILAKGVINVVKIVVGGTSASSETAPPPGSTTTNINAGSDTEDEISVSNCPDGEVPGVLYKGTTYSRNPNLGIMGAHYSPHADGGPTPTAQICADGTKPAHVYVNGNDFLVQ